jgi:single-stranded-DNA-specific exonuclease
MVDVAFQLRLNRWQGREQLQLELRGLRTSTSDTLVLESRQRRYWVRRDGQALVIRNAEGRELRRPAPGGGGPGLSPAREEPDPPQSEHPYVRALFQEAAMALGLAS